MRTALILFVTLVLVFQVAWKGSIRDQDLKVYRYGIDFKSLQVSEGEEIEGILGPHGCKAHTDPRSQTACEIAVLRRQAGESLRSSRLLLHLERGKFSMEERPSSSENVGILAFGEGSEGEVTLPSWGKLRWHVGEAGGVLLATQKGEFSYRSVERDVTRLSGIAEVDGNELVVLEEAIDRDGNPVAQVILLDFTEGQNLTPRPLVNLTRLQVAGAYSGISILPDHRTLVLVSFDRENPLARAEMVMIQLPGALIVRHGAAYVATILAILLSGVLLALGLRRGRGSGSAELQVAR